MRLIKLPKLRSERGDTIVEVLIAVAIVSIVLVTAYGVTNRNVQSGQTAQEQSYAQKLAQQQVELLRSADPRPDGVTSKCLNITTGGAATDNAVCQQTVGGATYTLSVTPTLPVVPNSGELYTVKAKWDVLGGGTSDVTMYYRVAQ